MDAPARDSAPVEGPVEAASAVREEARKPEKKPKAKAATPAGTGGSLSSASAAAASASGSGEGAPVAAATATAAAPAAPQPTAAPQATAAEPEVVPEPEKSPKEAIAPAAAGVRKRASSQRAHAPAETVAGDAQAAAIDPATEQKRSAASGTVSNIDGAEPGKVDRKDFKAKLKEALRKAVPTPKNADEAKELIDSGAGRTSGAIAGELGKQSQAAAGPVAAAIDPAAEVTPGSQPAPPTTELKPVEAGPAPASVSPASVVPEPIPDAKLDYSGDRKATDKLMSENDVSKQQMSDANEPEFSAAVKAHDEAESNEAAAAGKYRAGEGQVHQEAHGAAGKAIAGGLEGFHQLRSTAFGKVATEQAGTKSSDSAERARITAEVERIKNTTRENLGNILKEMERVAGEKFERGLKAAEMAYQKVFDKEKGGWLDSIGDFFTGGGDERLDRAFQLARAEYDREVSTTIDEIGNYVEMMLARAKARVAAGRKELDDYVASLDANLQKFGASARDKVAGEFDAMGDEIDSKKDALIGSLVEKYRASRTRLQALEKKLREENKSFWQRVYDATVGVVKAVIKFKNMLMNTLARAASVVLWIIKHPIEFLGNLIDGVKGGLDLFMGNIKKHMKEGLMAWLFGTMAKAGIQLPEKFDLKGVFGLIFQILGLTYDAIRARAAKILGEPVVARLEKVAEIFMVLKKEGLAGLWAMIKDKLTSLRDAVLDQIRDWIITKIIKAGIMWLIGLLNPAAAFIKACQAIYNIVKFFIERGKQILDLVNAIVDSLGAIAAGNLKKMAKAVEGALARGIPVAIGFLASLLGLGGISEKIKSVIETIQKPVGKAVDWIIEKAASVARKVGKLFGFGKKDEKGKKKDSPDDQADGGDLRSMSVEKILAQPPVPASRSAEEKKSDLDDAKLVLGRIVEASLTTEDVGELLPALKKRFGLVKAGFDKKGDLEISINPKATIDSQGNLIADADSLPKGLMKNEVKFESGSLGGDTVGKKMVATKLGPTHPQGGPPKSGAQKKLMEPLPTNRKLTGDSKYIRGHLLNDNVGGPGEPANLYPITADANRTHESEVESHVKKWVNDKRYWVFYSVTVSGEKTKKVAGLASDVYDANFVCHAYPLNSEGGKSNIELKKTIKSVFKGKPEETQTEGGIEKDDSLPGPVVDKKFKGKPELSSAKRSKIGDVSPEKMAELERAYGNDASGMRSVIGDIKGIGDKTAAEIHAALSSRDGRELSSRARKALLALTGESGAQRKGKDAGAARLTKGKIS